MILAYYFSMLAISVLLVIIYAFIFHKHFDVNLTIMTILVPVLNLGFVFMVTSATIEEALIGLKLSYIGGCFLLLSAMFLIYNVCGVNLKPWMRAVLVTVSFVIFAFSLTIGSKFSLYMTK